MPASERPVRNSARISAQRQSRAQRVSSSRPGLSSPVTLQPSSSSQPLPTAGASYQPLLQGAVTVQSNEGTHLTSAVRNRRAMSQPVATTPQENGEITSCPMCAVQVVDVGLMCEKCQTWFHPDCLFLTSEEYAALQQSSDQWFYDHCKAILTNSVKWGKFEGEETIKNEIQAAYKEICSWQKNFFLLPRGKAATDFIKELTRLLNLFVNKTKWFRLSFALVHVFMPIMLQKPSKKSKAKDHARYLLSRLQKWKDGNLHGLMAECREIQKWLLCSKRKQQKSDRKAFCRLMLVGKIKQAMGFINNNSDVTGMVFIILQSR